MSPRPVLYEDQGLDNEYRRGRFSEIPLAWNDAARTLSISARRGSFSGMLGPRRFEVIVVSPEHAVGFSFTPAPERSVEYGGEALDVEFD